MYQGVLSAAAAAGAGAGAGGVAELAPDDVDGWLRMREQVRAKPSAPSR